MFSLCEEEKMLLQMIDAIEEFGGGDDTAVLMTMTMTMTDDSPSDDRDSGLESTSTSSTPESPLTPHEERSVTPAEKISVDQQLLNDAFYRIRIVAPHTEPFDLQVNSAELVQEVQQVLLEREATCHRTCFSLQLDGRTLDNFTELKNIPGLNDGCTLRVVEEPYTIREARIHIRHVRELTRALEISDAINGVDGASICYLACMTLGERRRTIDRTIDCGPPEWLLPGAREPGLSALLNPPKERIQALKCLSISPFNPPPGHRKMKGDVLYLTVDTMENRSYPLTCCTRGFFVNSSTNDEFHWAPLPNHRTIYHSLVDLLYALSPTFKKNLSLIIKKRSEKHIFERLPTPYQVHSWVAPQLEHSADGIRAEDGTQPHRIGLEDHIPGQVRDWNEELQTTHELPRGNLAERLIRERAIFKIHSDFVAAAVRGAMTVVEGNVMAINPADDPRTHMYIWNNIFFSLGFDVKEHYKQLGGDAAAHAATANDLQGVKAYAALDTAKLHTLGMVVVDYRGLRVTAQSIIPGILERDQEQSVVYGSTDFGKTINGNEQYTDLLQKPAEQLKICPHSVLSGKEEGNAHSVLSGKEEGNGEVPCKEKGTVLLHSSFETKGIVGNDSRCYILDLLRTFPPDVNFLPEAGVTELCQANGYPRKFPHKLACLRPELIDAFVEFRYMTFVRVAAYHLQHMHNNASSSSSALSSDVIAGDEMADVEETVSAHTSQQMLIAGEDVLPEANEAQLIIRQVDEADGSEANITRQAIAKAATAVGSLSTTGFEIRFNPDCFCETVIHSPMENLEKQRALVREAAEFLLAQQLPCFIRECLQHTSTPVDGQVLCQALHSRGINIRYLGKLISCLEGIEQLDYFLTVCATELLCRVVKHLFRVYIQAVPQAQLATAIAHFLNCLIGCSVSQTGQAEDVQTARRVRSGRRRRGVLAASTSEEITQLTGSGLWKLIREECDSYFGYPLKSSNCDEFVEHFHAQKISIVRRFCISVGIQLLLKDYCMDSRNQRIFTFTEDDIQNMLPIVKHREPRAGDAQALMASAQAKMQAGALRSAFDLAVEALALMNNVYGALHSDMAPCMRLLARLAYVLGDPGEALAQQHKATLVSERCFGVDHANTVNEYVSLAHFSFANLHITASLRLLYRARYLLLLIHSESHPLMAQIDGNIGVVLYAMQEYDVALKFLGSALRLLLKLSGASMKTALLHHLLARTHSCRGDFRTALQHEKETFQTYTKLLGVEHEKTRESGECLRHLTQQAVTFQKRMNEASRTTGSISTLLPIQVQQPSLHNVLEVLNAINGIIFVQLRPAQAEEPLD